MQDAEDEEIELDIDQLSGETLFELERYVNRVMQAIRSKAGAADRRLQQNLANKAQDAAAAAQRAGNAATVAAAPPPVAKADVSPAHAQLSHSSNGAPVHQLLLSYSSNSVSTQAQS